MASSDAYRRNRDGDRIEGEEDDGMMPSTSAASVNVRDTMPLTTGSKDQARWTCCSACSCTRSDVIFLVVKIICLLVTASVTTVQLVSTRSTHGECMLTAGYTPLGYVITGHTHIYCDLPLYYSMITSILVFMSLMIDWIADIKDSIRWLVMQITLSVVITMGMIGISASLMWAFFNWCQTIRKALPATSQSPRCHANVAEFQRISDQNFHLPGVYMLTMLEMALCVLAFLVWLAVASTGIWRLKVGLKELQHILEEDEDDDEGDDPEGKFADVGGIIMQYEAGRSLRNMAADNTSYTDED